MWDEYDSILPPPSCDCSKAKEYVEQMQYQRLLQFLMGLNDNYSQARGQILMMNILPTVNQVYALVMQDESQKGIAGTVNERMESLALYTARNNRNQQFNNMPRKNYQSLYCDFCNMKGHIKAYCNKLKKCDHCHATGHVKGNCYQLIGYPENFKGKKRVDTVFAGGTLYPHQLTTGGGDSTSFSMQEQTIKIGHMTAQEHMYNDQGTQEQVLLQLLHKTSPEQIHNMIDVLKKTTSSMDSHHSVNMAGIDNSNPSYYLKWIIDTGAIDHMISNSNHLHVGKVMKHAGNVQLPTGESATVTHIGSIQLNETEMINGVLCIPSLSLTFCLYTS